MSLAVDDLYALGPNGEALVNGVSLAIAPGETLALLGASGSGKSLTGRAIMALPPPGVSFRGKVLLAGANVLREPERQQRRRRGAELAMVFQEPATALDPVQRIGAQIAEPMRLHTDWDRPRCAARVAELLDRTGLTAAGVGPERFAHELSGGQRQRVALAIAMALSPRVVVADEPTSALDSVAAARVLGLLADMTAETGAALLLITHDLEVAARADRIAVMDAGRIVEENAARAFLARPKSQAGRALVGTAAVIAPVTPGPVQLCASDLSASARDLAILTDVSLSVRRGERVAIVGASGSGKTTLARALLGLVPSAGTVTIDGESVSLKERRRRVQMVFQDPAASFNPRRSVEWAVTEPLHTGGLTRNDRRERAAQALTAVGLDPAMMTRKPHAFSGGQRQRIAVARALVSAPDILIADEAVSALDAALRHQIVSLLATLTAERAMALVFISHDLRLVNDLAHRVLVMDSGKIVEEAAPENLMRAPHHPASQALVEAAVGHSRYSVAQRLQPGGAPAKSKGTIGA